MPTLPAWQYTEDFACPNCRAQQKDDMLSTLYQYGRAEPRAEKGKMATASRGDEDAEVGYASGKQAALDMDAQLGWGLEEPRPTGQRRPEVAMTWDTDPRDMASAAPALEPTAEAFNLFFGQRDIPVLDTEQAGLTPAATDLLQQAVPSAYDFLPTRVATTQEQTPSMSEITFPEQFFGKPAGAAPLTGSGTAMPGAKERYEAGSRPNRQIQ